MIYKYTFNTFNSFTFNLSSTQSNLHSHHMIRLRSLVFRVSCHSESFLPFQPDGTSIFGLSPLPLHPHLNSITSDLSLVLATSTRAPMRCASCGLSKSNDSPFATARLLAILQPERSPYHHDVEICIRHIHQHIIMHCKIALDLELVLNRLFFQFSIFKRHRL